jgi:hypothetical protein
MYQISIKSACQQVIVGLVMVFVAMCSIVSVSAQTLSTNATLSDIRLSATSYKKPGLSPAFSSATTSYTTIAETAQMTVAAYFSGTGKTVTINGTAAVNGTAQTIDLALGANTITIVVTAQDGITTKTYSITATRYDPVSVTLSPVYCPSSACDFPLDLNAQNSISFATVTGGTGTYVYSGGSGTVPSGMTISGAGVLSGNPGAAVSSSTNLFYLCDDAGFCSNLIYAYYGQSQAALTASTTASTIEVSQNATVSASGGSGSGAVTFSTSNSAVAYVNPTSGVVLGAGVGTATITAVRAKAAPYSVSNRVTVDITVTSSTNANLSSLNTTPSTSGTIAPSFTGATTDYTATTPNSTTSITVRPVASQTNSTITVNGATVATSTSSSPIDLNVGANVITVLVTAQDGTTTKTYTLTVTRLLPLPTVTGISPRYGKLSGGDAVTITGTNFTGATSVNIPTSNISAFQVVNDTTITATTNARSAGTVDVNVTTPAGTGTGAGLFTYVNLPTVSAVSPTSGPTAGGTNLTLTGTNFTAASDVKFNGVSATGVTVVSPTQITLVTPASQGGIYVSQNASVVVYTPGGSNSSNSLFSYVAPALSTTGVANSVYKTLGSSTSFSPVQTTGGKPSYVYSISPAVPAGLSFNTATGEVSGTPTALSSLTSYKIVVTDALGARTNTFVSFGINPSLYSVVRTATKTLTAGTAVSGSWIPVSKGGGSSPWSFAISPALPTGLNFSTSDGQITGTPPASAPATAYTVTITDGDGVTASGSFSLTTSGALVVSQAIATTTLTQNNYGGASFSPVTAGGGTAPLTYSVSPSLPSGLSIAPSTGVISGTAGVTQAATTYTVTVSDANTPAITRTATFSLRVNSALTASTAVASNTLSLDRAAAAFTPVTASGGTAPVTYSITPSLPSGLVLATATGQITGVPTTVSPLTSYAVALTDANGATSGSSFTLETKSAQTIAFTTAEPDSAFAGGSTYTPDATSSSELAVAITIDPSSSAVCNVTSGIVSFLTPGTCLVNADQSGDATTFAATRVQQSIPVVARTIPTVMLIPSTYAPTFGDSVTLTASLSTDQASGTVTFKDGTTVLGSGVVIDGVATFTTSSLGASLHPLTAVYSGDATTDTASSVVLSLTVAPAETSATLAVSSATPVYGTLVTMTATITPANATGSVDFYDGEKLLGSGTLSGGIATLETAALTGGAHPALTARFAGNANYQGSTSLDVVATVSTVATTSVVSVTDTAPSYGDVVTFLATVAPTGATGSVQFYDGAFALGGPATVVNGQARLIVFDLSVGLHSVTADYSGDDNFGSSISSAISVTTTTKATDIALTASDYNPAINQSFTLTATLSSQEATGTVTFKNGGSPLMSATVSGGVATLSLNTLPAGSYDNLTAEYSGDGNFDSAVSDPAPSVVVGPQTTTTTLISSSQISTYGTGFTLTATVAPTVAGGIYAPTGQVVFKDGSKTLGQGPILAGTATATLTLAGNDLTSGVHSLTASFVTSDGNFTSSTAEAETVTVSPAAISISLTASRSTVAVGEATTFSVSGVPSDATGVVTYKVGLKALAVVQLTAGGADFTTSALPVGAQDVVAEYSGDQNYTVDSSAPFTVTVVPASTEVTLTPSSTALSYGAALTLSANVSQTAGVGPLSGNVTFSEGSTILGTQTVSGSGTAVLTLATLEAGEHVITAHYAGDNNNDPSENTATVTVSAETTSLALTVSAAAVTYGQNIQLSATISPNIADGVISFTEGGSEIGSAVINNGLAVFNTTGLAPGSHNITAEYAGNSNFDGSASSPELINVTVPALTSTIPSAVKLTSGITIAGFSPTTGSGGFGSLSYTITPSLPLGLSINPATGQISGTPPVSGTNFSRTYQIRVSDSATPVAKYVNKNWALTIFATVSANQSIASTALTKDQSVTSFTPVTAAGGATPPGLVYSVSPSLPAGLAFNTATGAITGTPTATSLSQSYVVNVVDTNGSTASRSFALSVNDVVTATQSVTTTSFVLNATAIPFIPVTGAGGTGPLSYSVSPSLPSGLSMSLASGQVSGTPTATSVDTVYTATVTDANGATATSTFNLMVNSALALSPAAGTLTGGAVGTAYTATLLTGSGGISPYEITVTDGILPPGLSISAGNITGTPTTAGAFPFTVTLRDSTGTDYTFSATYNISITGLPTVTSVSPSSGLISGGTSITITGTKFLGATRVTIAGLEATDVTVVSATSITAKTPYGAAGTASVLVTTGGGTNISNTRYTFTAPTVLTSPSAGALTAGAVGTAYSQAFTGSGGTSPYFTAISSGTLPDGLQLSGNSLTGTPTTAGVYSFTITTTDSRTAPALTTQTPYTLTITGAPTVNSVSPASASASGGTTITITGANLLGATGITIAGVPVTEFTIVDSTTILAVTPPGVVGTASVIITTAGGTTASNSLFANSQPSLVTDPAAATPAEGPLGAPYAQTLAIEGGIAPYVAAVKGGSTLPPGLTLVGNVISGTPTTAGHYTYTLTITDSSMPTPSTINVTYTLDVAGEPTVTSVSPAIGAIVGGNSVTITGTHLLGTTSVTIGGAAASDVYINSETEITATVPAGSAGVASVVVTTGGGANADNTLYTYAPVPRVSAISPAIGPAAGGTAVAITGTGFSGATNVTIGGISATGVVVVSDTSITATVPAGTGGSASVEVTTIGGTSRTNTLYTYLLAPAVTSISPAIGPLAGGTTITITGTNLLGANSVTVGGSPVSAFTVINASTIIATTPAAAAGTASVEVTTDGGTNAGNTLYTYADRSTVTAVNPNVGPTAGGTTVTITGQLFSGASAVSIGGRPVTSFVVDSDSTITATVPAGTAGAASVQVTTAAGTSVTNALYAYSALPTVTTISPAIGPVAGGTAVTITGTAFAGATGVTIGGTSATSVTVVNSTTITAIVPAGTAGLAGVVVTTPGGSSISNRLYTYVTAPIFSSITPASGPAAGGTVVIVSGTGLENVSAVTVGGSVASNLTLVNASSISFRTPTGTVGTASVILTTPGGTNAANSAFTYLPNLTVATSVATTTLTQGTAATAFTPVTSSGGYGTLTYAVSPSLPKGLSFDTTTGQISGTPSAQLSSTTFTVTVTDSTTPTAQTDTATFDLAVSPAALTAATSVATTTLTQGTAATAFTPVTSSGGYGTLTYAVSPSLPTGLSFDTTTGQISGTPSAQLSSTTFTVTVTDSTTPTAQTDTATFDLAVNEGTSHEVVSREIGGGITAYMAARLDRIATSLAQPSRIQQVREMQCGFSQKGSLEGDGTEKQAQLDFAEALDFVNAGCGCQGGDAVAGTGNCGGVNTWLRFAANHVGGPDQEMPTFAAGSTGVEYMLSPTLLAGLRANVDYTDFSTGIGEEANATMSGIGWIAGPYLSAELMNNVFFESFVGYGTSLNTYSGHASGSDFARDFRTERLVSTLGLSGKWEKGAITLVPAFGVTYAREWNSNISFPNQNYDGVNVPDGEVTLGRINAKLQAQYKRVNRAGNEITLMLSPSVSFSSQRSDSRTFSNTSADESVLSSIDAAASYDFGGGITLNFNLRYEGRGASDWAMSQSGLQFGYRW